MQDFFQSTVSNCGTSRSIAAWITEACCTNKFDEPQHATDRFVGMFGFCDWCTNLEIEDSGCFHWHRQNTHRQGGELVAFDHVWVSNGFPGNIASEAYCYLGVKQWCQFLRLLGDSWERKSMKRRKKFAACCVIHRQLFAPKDPKIITDIKPTIPLKDMYYNCTYIYIYIFNPPPYIHILYVLFSFQAGMVHHISVCTRYKPKWLRLNFIQYTAAVWVTRECSTSTVEVVSKVHPESKC